jgi:hypothetical protein
VRPRRLPTPADRGKTPPGSFQVGKASGLGIALLIGMGLARIGSVAEACPFCGVVAEPLAWRRDAAACVAVGEPAGAPSIAGDGLPERPFRLLAILRGDCGDAGSVVKARPESPAEGTAILFGRETAGDGPRSWAAIAADESLIAHVATAPATDRPAAERLRWFAPRLDHSDPRIADDAFAEFGIAPFEAVREACDAFAARRLAERVADPLGDQRKRGFFGLALGLVAVRTRDPREREAAIAVLEQAVAAPGDDFRAGFDGLLAGLLVAEGEAGLDRIESLGLFGRSPKGGAPRTAPRPVDQRHLLAALRFAWESLPESIPRGRIGAATRRLLDAPVVAADAVVDLARYGEWTAVDAVADLWNSTGRDDPLVRRAVAGYLSACPRPEAGKRLDTILHDDPLAARAALEAARLPLGR